MTDVSTGSPLPERAATGSWWAQRQATYRRRVVVSAVAAYSLQLALLAGLGGRLPEVDPTAVTLGLHAVALAVGVRIAFLAYGLGPCLEPRLQPLNVDRYRTMAYRAGTTLAIVTPFVSPIALAVTAIRELGAT